MNLVRIAAGLALVAAAAAPGPAAAAKKGEAGYDPDRQICKSKPAIGSRLKRVRECHTAQEWEDLKLQEQVGLMRKQINGDPGCSGGGPCGVERGGKDTPW
ncbi:MAG TPA: hypothetical protein VEA61_12380 [Allosphingosinicella sp.]|nr:hypothetical protein [Allosphingosinicella sp.]